ncbi:MAG: hypothetical protein HY329_02615 [Chloroflexi bacterium]|nr:hypothetical protein [Chloroflexota bacterium]
MRRKRPFGVAVIAIAQLLRAAGLASVAGLIALAQAFTNTDMPIAPFRLGPGDLLLVPLGILTVIGLWRLRWWAWFATMIWIGVTMAVDLWWYFHGAPRYGSMLLNVVIVFYLNQREVRRPFRTEIVGESH